jgi:hypothetical protein
VLNVADHLTVEPGLRGDLRGFPDHRTGHGARTALIER